MKLDVRVKKIVSFIVLKGAVAKKTLLRMTQFSFMFKFNVVVDLPTHCIF